MGDQEHLSVSRLSEPGAHLADVIPWTPLGELYVLADVAFVGGALLVAGLHSVLLELAAFGGPYEAWSGNMAAAMPACSSTTTPALRRRCRPCNDAGHC